jgi:hypothetical protein
MYFHAAPPIHCANRDQRWPTPCRFHALRIDSSPSPFDHDHDRDRDRAETTAIKAQKWEISGIPVGSASDQSTARSD